MGVLDDRKTPTAPGSSAHRRRPPASPSLVPIASSQAAATTGSHRVPKTVVIDGKRLQAAKVRLDQGDPALRKAARNLTARADDWLGQGPWTVVDKPKPAPGGDLARLSEPGPLLVALPAQDRRQPAGAAPTSSATASAIPRSTPAPTAPTSGRSSTPPTTLSLAWYYTGKKQYAEHAADDPAHLVPRPGDPDEPEPEPRAVHPLQVRRPGHRHHRLLAVVHQRPGRARPPRHRRPRLVRAATGPAMRAWNKRLPRLAGEQRLRQGGGRRPRTTTARSTTCRSPRSPHATGDKGLARTVVLDARAKRIDAADRGRRQPAAGARADPELALLDLRPGRVHPARGHRPARRAWTCGRTGARTGRACSRRSTTCCPPRPARRPGRTRSWSSTGTRRATSCTRPPTPVTPRRGPRCRTWRTPPGGDLWALRPAAEQLDSIAG